MLLQVSEVVSHHGDVGAPVFKTNEYTHADFVDAGLSHTVETVQAPFENRLHSLRMVHFVAVFVVSLLKAHHAVKPCVC